jgi:hypothetical protein
MKYCQGPKCHEYHTKDRIRGPKGDKHYETRKRSSFNYNDNFCSLGCQDDWFKMHGSRAIDHFGRTHEPKRTDASGAWYKDYKYRHGGLADQHYFVNDLLGQRISITPQQYNDADITTPPG